ncbi:RNase adapter RapZ [Aliikangiella marina]|uniref:RNase adapter RapZ n=1 Tax=Aliikangiella marina TaxID=1712262 RepID=A0A545T6N0_9GAMM|nr:RNase adapter RapZ [Aliikangiella marina]TQV72876.1 RNase adapter RapZ [Aliikangiella marina]
MKRIIVSGRSGSGKTVALRALEDQGFYCVDNIPIKLIPALLEQIDTHYPGLAIGVDARNVTHTVEEFDKLIQQITASKLDLDVIFIDANDATLLKRFSETRRRHPLTSEGLSLAEAIQKEKQRLEPVTRYAQLVIDTTSKSPHELCQVIMQRVLGDESSHLSLLFTSFGFKNGAPNDADFVFDARCLPNPYWEESLRPFTGKDQPIVEYLESQPHAQEFYWQLKIFLQTWIPRFEEDNRNYLTVAIGCTGGQHRSVYLAEKLAANFKQLYPNTQIRHREMST